MENDKAKPKSTSDSAEPNNEFLIVGLGASAGGIQALKAFFTQVPKDSGMAYVVILHMSPEHESKLAEILQMTCSIPVTQVKQREKVVRDHVYVIPPNQNLSMTDGHLTPTTMIGVEERRSPVDLFFRTLAETNDSRAVSVILSGTGANGSMGLKRIKEHGGVAFVQDPGEAEYTDMPRNAIATGMVDYVLPVAEIPAKIVSYRQHRATIQIPEIAEESAVSDEQALREIFTQLRRRTGHDFQNYKRGTMLRRIERRLGLRELTGLTDYAQFLKGNAGETKLLMKDLLISVTNFFRDPQSVDALAKTVISKLVQGPDESHQLRIWIAGCATGEEAYTLAMVLSEAMGNSRFHSQLQLFATDLDADAIAVAREGHYSEADVADVSPERLRRFFIREAGGYRVKRELREMTLFAVHNVIKDPPFSHLDLISCRNLLIYLNRTAQSRALEVMHFALNPQGYLFLGGSESVEGAADLFSTVDKEHHIYQSRPVAVRRIFPVPDLNLKFQPPRLPERTAQELQAMERLSYLDLHQRMLEQFAPPSIVVNEEYEIVHLSERAGQFLQFTGGEPSYNLLKLVRPELRMELRSTLYQAVNTRANVQARGLAIDTVEGKQTVDLIVRPVLKDGDPARGFLLILFQKQDPEENGEEMETIRPAEPLARHLEEELMQSKSQLRATVEQYEIQQEELRASNEELQAMNEELRSSAEELETSKEELQSLNEELSTVNQELKIKIEELSQANNDFANLMNSTDIGTIFLDGELRVKLFTPRARDLFNLISSDIGRSLLDITNNLAYVDLGSDIIQVLKTLRVVSREVQSTEGKWYLVRILPYRTVKNYIEGVVITSLDITESRQTKNDLVTARDSLETKVAERTTELEEANRSLTLEVGERRQAEALRLKLLSQLVMAQEFERRRLARDLHDHLGQQLTGLRLKLESLKDGAEKRAKLKEQVDELLSITTQLDSDIEFLAWELRPVTLDDIGLAAALRNYVSRWADQFGVAAEFHTTGFERQRPAPEVENNLYRITQEALNNIAKHARASQVDVIFERRDHSAVLIIEDNGVGFEPGEERGPETMGVTSMRERAALIGASLEIESTPDKGTSIFVRVPLTEAKAKDA